jgi:DNA modification methylase
MSCDRKIGPFDCCSVVHGDCLELVGQIRGKDFDLIDAVVSDPPYGISYRSGKNSRNSISSTGKRFTESIYGDREPFNPEPWLFFPVCVFTGAQHFYTKLTPNGSLHAWDKRGDYKPLDQSDSDIVWSSRKLNSRTFHCVWRGLCRNVEITEPILHPTQKPVELMAWCIELAGPAKTILDPFCGSGSTLVAAAKLGRHFLGFEMSPEYCEIARKRIAAVEAQPTLFQPKPEQQELGI